MKRNDANVRSCCTDCYLKKSTSHLLVYRITLTEMTSSWKMLLYLNLSFLLTQIFISVHHWVVFHYRIRILLELSVNRPIILTSLRNFVEDCDTCKVQHACMRGQDINQYYTFFQSLVIIIRSSSKWLWYLWLWTEYEPRWKRDMSSAPAVYMEIEHSTLRLRCDADGRPTPVVTWYKDDKPFTSRQHGTVS